MSDSEMMTMVEDLCHTNRDSDRPKGFVGVMESWVEGRRYFLGFFMFPS